MKKKCLFNIAWTIFIYAVILAVFIFCNVHFNAELKNKASHFEYYCWMVVESFGLLIIALLYAIAITLQWKDIKHFSEKIIYSFITLNIVWLIETTTNAYKRGFIRWKIKKWNTIDYPLIGLAICLYIVLTLIDKLAIPQVPILFISLSLEYIAVFFIAWITESFLKTLVTGFICGMFLLALPTTYFINFGQFCFDYLFDNMVVAFAAFVIIKKQDKNKPLRWISFFTIPYILVFWSRVVGGIIFYKSFAWSGFPLFLYSVIINGLNTFCDYLVMVIIGPIIFSRIYVLKAKYDNKNKTHKIAV